MSSIELSAGMMAGLPQRMIRLNDTSTTNTETVSMGIMGMLIGADRDAQGQPYNDSSNANSCLQICKGIIPVDFTGIGAYSSRASDVLIEYTSGDSMFSTTTQTNVNPAIISTLYKKAKSAGLATWFRMFSNSNLTNGNVPGNHIFTGPQIAGTVGLIGSGADLEIPDTNIILNENYRVLNLRILFPSIWNY